MLTKLEKSLFFLTVLFLPTQLGKHFWPNFSYIYSLRVDYLSPTIYFWDLLVTGLLVVFLIQGKRINKVALNLILLFLLGQALSLVPHIRETGLIGIGLTRLEEYLFACFFGLYLASSNFAKLTKSISLPLLFSIVGESSIAIGQFLKGGTLGIWLLGERSFTVTTAGIAKFDFYGREFLRPYATFPHPNVLAAFLVIASMILTVFSIKAIRPLIFKIAILFATVTTLLTVSRTAILAGFTEALFLLNKKWRIALLAVALILSPVLITRYVSILNFDNLSLVRREELSGAAFNMWLKSPFLGVGLNNFIPSVANGLLVGPSRFMQPVHNIFLLALAETGILGLLGLLGLLGYPVYRIIKSQSSNLKFPMLMIWGVIFFLGLFDHYFLTLPQGYRLVFLFWGICMAMPMP